MRRRIVFSNPWKLLCIWVMAIAMLPCSVFPQEPGQKDLLWAAYRERSDSLSCLFFENWAKEFPPNETAVTNDTIREAYEVYRSFYATTFSENLKDERIASVYQDQPFVVVQGTLQKVCVEETIPYTPQECDSFLVEQIRRYFPEEHWEMMVDRIRSDDSYFPRHTKSIDRFLQVPSITVDSAIDFRPALRYDNKEVLYLTKGYGDLLRSFVGEQETYRHEPPSSYDVKWRRRKVAFLNRMIPVLEYHKDANWRYLPGPYVHEIVLDSHLQRAVVVYSGLYAGFQTIMEKQNGEWVVLDTQGLWQE
ncbi:MAG: hypothetical protein J6T86_02095 [Bacteroidales bacterium]|nr:hypothetical protein [Bacteroidales bacterium]